MEYDSVLQSWSKIFRPIADLEAKLTFQAIWKVLVFSLEMTRLLKIEKWLEDWPLQPLTKILRQIADLQEKLTFQAIWEVLIFSLEMTRLLKIEKWLEAWPLGCHPARNGHVTH